MTITQIYPEKLSKKELGYIVGFYIGDGYSYHGKDRCYIVEFYFNSIRDIKMFEYIKSLLEKIGLNPFLIKDKRFNSIRVKVSSKNFWKKIGNEIKSIKENTNNEDCLIGFISGFIDAEGYVNNGEIQLAQKEKETLIMVKDFCKLLKIPTRKFWSVDNYKSKNKLWRLRISTDFKNIEHNSIKVWRKYSLHNSS